MNRVAGALSYHIGCRPQNPTNTRTLMKNHFDTMSLTPRLRSITLSWLSLSRLTISVLGAGITGLLLTAAFAFEDGDVPNDDTDPIDITDAPPPPPSQANYPISLSRFSGVDFNNDRVSDLVFWRPSTGVFYISNSAGKVGRYFGLSGDIAVPGDYDGDRKTDLATWRPANATWSVEFSSGAGVVGHVYGRAGDIPVPGDYNSDGVTDLAVFRPSTGEWSVSNTAGQRDYQFGLPGDTPVPGDYDGDGTADLATWRPSDGSWMVQLSSTGEISGPHPWGSPGDIPVPADYNADGVTDVAFFRPTTAVWYISNTAGQNGCYFGLAGDVPVPGDYDGDGKTDLATWRPSEGTWWVQLSATGQLSGPHPWGEAGDIPLPSRVSTRKTQLSTALSRKTHTGVGSFDIDLPLAGRAGVECRNSNGEHTLVFTFTDDVISGNATVTSATGHVSGTPVFAGKTMMVNLVGVANAQTVTVKLSGVTDSYFKVVPDCDVNVSFLAGDSNADGIVNAGDALQTRSYSGQAANSTNFRSDVNADGSINGGDALIVRGRSGQSVL